MFYFLYDTLVFTIYIDAVLALSISFATFIFAYVFYILYILYDFFDLSLNYSKCVYHIRLLYSSSSILNWYVGFDFICMCCITYMSIKNLNLNLNSVDTYVLQSNCVFNCFWPWQKNWMWNEFHRLVPNFIYTCINVHFLTNNQEIVT